MSSCDWLTMILGSACSWSLSAARNTWLGVTSSAASIPCSVSAASAEACVRLCSWDSATMRRSNTELAVLGGERQRGGGSWRRALATHIARDALQQLVKIEWLGEVIG